MQFLTALSSSEILVSIAFTLFAVLIVSSICLRIRTKTRVRKSLPNDIARSGFRFFPSLGEENQQVEIPEENFDRIYPARPKVQEINGDPVFNNADLTLDGSVSIQTGVPVFEVGEQVAHADWSDVEHSSETVRDGHGDYSEEEERDVRHQPAYASETTDHQRPTVDETVFAGGSADGEISSTQETPNGDFHRQNEFEEGLESNSQWRNEDPTGQWDSSDVQPTEESLHSNIDAANEDSVNSISEIAANSTSQHADVEHSSSDEMYERQSEHNVFKRPPSNEEEESVTRMNPLVHDTQRVGALSQSEAENSLSVVSICLVSNFENRVFRDISGDRLASFLNNRGFIFLDEEYYLKTKVTRNSGIIRVRNLESIPIGDLVRKNDYTRGFRLYFRPSEVEDSLATLNEMLKIAQSATGYFTDLGGLPLQIYHGLREIKPLTQEDYESLRNELRDAYPSQLGVGSRRTHLQDNESAFAQQLGTLAGQY